MDESNLPGKTHTTMPCVQFRCVVVAAAVVVDIKKPVLNYTDYTLISRLQYRSTSPTVIPISAPVPQKWTPHHTLKSRAVSPRNAINGRIPDLQLSVCSGISPQFLKSITNTAPVAGKVTYIPTYLKSSMKSEFQRPWKMKKDSSNHEHFIAQVFPEAPIPLGFWQLLLQVSPLLQHDKKSNFKFSCCNDLGPHFRFRILEIQQTTLQFIQDVHPGLKQMWGLARQSSAPQHS